MFNLYTFMLSDLEKELLSARAIDDISEQLFTLELYKIVARDAIIAALLPLYPDLCDIKQVNQADEFYTIEKQYEVIIDVISNKELRVISEVFTDVDRVTLNIALCNYDVEYAIVTKLNYRELRGVPTESLYDSDLLSKRIIIEAINQKATDIHFSVEHTSEGVQYPIYFRCNGLLHKSDLFTLNKDLNKEIISKFIEKKTNSISLDLNNSSGVTTNKSGLFKTHSLELRISANAVADGLRCVMRLQEKTTTSLQMNELGFDKEIQEVIEELAYHNSGITFITGAIRTGKNTTAFAIANGKVKENLSMISYDSPIEVLMPFPQVDYKDDPKRLLDCVRLAKKQDIDIAFLNEIPSKDVAFAVKDLVTSSIGVITTLHLNRIWDLPFRLYEYYGESYKDVIMQTNGVINQKMFGVMCPSCRRLSKSSEVKQPFLRKALFSYKVDDVFVSEGCKDCYDMRSDNKGLIPGKNQPYAEALLFDEELKSQLVHCSTPWEMAAILKDTVYSRELNIERFMVRAIKAGKLPYDALQAVL